MSNDHPNPKVTRLACHNRLFLILQLVVIQLLFPFGHASAKIKRGHGRASLQELQLIPNADLLTNVLCGRLGRFNSLSTILGFPKKLRKEAYRLLLELGVGENPHKWAKHMSGGEKQRVAAARVLFQKPKIYFADEPASSLDAYYAGRVLGLLRQEADEKAKPVLCVLHNAEHIQRFADIALSLNQNDPRAHKMRRVRTVNQEAQV